MEVGRDGRTREVKIKWVWRCLSFGGKRLELGEKVKGLLGMWGGIGSEWKFLRGSKRFWCCFEVNSGRF
jgi:hypothetical protein